MEIVIITTEELLVQCLVPFPLPGFRFELIPIGGKVCRLILYRYTFSLLNIEEKVYLLKSAHFISQPNNAMLEGQLVHRTALDLFVIRIANNAGGAAGNQMVNGNCNQNNGQWRNSQFSSLSSRFTIWWLKNQSLLY